MIVEFEISNEILIDDVEDFDIDNEIVNDEEFFKVVEENLSDLTAKDHLIEIIDQSPHLAKTDIITSYRCT